MKIMWALILICCLLIFSAAFFVWSGIYNVAANVPHWKSTYWVLSTVRERSIAAHSREVVIPATISATSVKDGPKNYHVMCLMCHSAPGYSPSEVAGGLYPSPPVFTSNSINELSAAEVYWVVKNGIKMTGMAAFGPTHGDEELWGIVLFVQRLPGISAQEYKTILRETGLNEGEGHHH
jgi:mono/diheme cytochrome c family protein